MDRSFFGYLGLLTQLGLVVLSSTFIGLFLGIFLDRKLNSKPLITIVCLIFGIIGGFISAYKLIKEKAS